MARNVIARLSRQRSGASRRVRRDHRAQRSHRLHAPRRSITIRCARSTRSFARLGADSPPREPSPAEAARIRAILDSLRRLRPPRPDSIYNGADDDGSGTIALIEIAEAFMKRRRQAAPLDSASCRTPPRKRGLLGSEWFTDHPTVPIDSIVAEFDVDMIGRGAATDIKGGGPTYLEVVGLRRLSKEFGDWLEAANAKEPTPFVFNYEYDAPGHPEQYYCRADHYSYARYGIPSVSLSRGAHMDYHQVTDEPQYIDYPDYARLTQLVFDAAIFVANADHARGSTCRSRESARSLQAIDCARRDRARDIRARAAPRARRSAPHSGARVARVRRRAGRLVEPDVHWESFDAVVIRRAGTITSAFARVSSRGSTGSSRAGMPVFNSPASFAGTPTSVICSIWRRAASRRSPRCRCGGVRADVERWSRAEGWTRFVIKPAISASGYETYAFAHRSTTDGPRRCAGSHVGDVLVQPFAEEVPRDRRILLHVHRRRVQSRDDQARGRRRVSRADEHGGSVERIDASDSLVEQAARASACCPKSRSTPASTGSRAATRFC